MSSQSVSNYSRYIYWIQQDGNSAFVLVSYAEAGWWSKLINVDVFIIETFCRLKGRVEKRARSVMWWGGSVEATWLEHLNPVNNFCHGLHLLQIFDFN